MKEFIQREFRLAFREELLRRLADPNLSEEERRSFEARLASVEQRLAEAPGAPAPKHDHLRRERPRLRLRRLR